MAGDLQNVLHGKLLDVGQVLVILTEIAEVHLGPGFILLLDFRERQQGHNIVNPESKSPIH